MGLSQAGEEAYEIDYTLFHVHSYLYLLTISCIGVFRTWVEDIEEVLYIPLKKSRGYWIYKIDKVQMKKPNRKQMMKRNSEKM